MPEKKPATTTPNGRKRAAAKKKPSAKSRRSTTASAKTTKSQTEEKTPTFPTVGIGASAGGLEALQELFDHMPTRTGMTFVVIMHQHPGHVSLLPELLARHTSMPVVEGGDGISLEPNHVYIGSAEGHMAILAGKLHLMERESEETVHLPIDYFFRSLAEDQHERAICIVLSGTGTDGTLGVKAVKAASGMAMAQKPQSARYAGMPASAIETGLVDYVLPPSEIPEQLLAYVKGPYLTTRQTAVEMPVVAIEPMQKIFVLIRNRTGHDFSDYKSSTIRRRIERRMNVHQIEKPDQYVHYLQENRHEVDILFKELLISVTNFFRDQEAWQVLSLQLEDLIKTRPESHKLRIWVPGCASGEEAFSLAIALREAMDKTRRHLDVQIFATDLDSAAIDTARIGQYPEGIAVDISPAYLERYFIHEDHVYRIRKEIREMVIFAPQNVIKDPPFTKLDLISCRNLLIYLNTDLQRKLLPVFHYALNPDGLLFLGPSETIGSFTDLFIPVNKRWKIFRRQETITTIRNLPQLPSMPISADSDESRATAAESSSRKVHISTPIERMLLSRHVPASIVVNEQGDIIYIHGRTGAYLEPTQGEPRNNLLDMAREGLRIELPSALRECVRKDKEIIRENIRVKTNGDFILIQLSVSKISEPEAIRGLLLVTFLAMPPPNEPTRKRVRKRSGDDGAVEQLERELQYLKESHQTTLEELETSNEELKSTNEELQSTNEELQSSNEELETSKEEMQSLNEELTTVNAQLQAKVDELSQANDDMQNLLNSTDIATVFLDNELNIKRFTEQAKELVMFRQTDVGRPIAELASNLKYNKLTEDCRNVLKNLAFKEREVRTKDGSWYLMRIMPYRTAENVIDGLVLTFVDVNLLKEAQKKLWHMSTMFKEGLDPFIIVDLSGRVIHLNNEAILTYGFAREEMIGKPITSFIPQQHHQLTRDLLNRCRSGESLRDIQYTLLNKTGQEWAVILMLTLLTDEHGESDAIAMCVKPAGK